MKTLAALSICLGAAAATATAGVSQETITPAPASSGWVGDVNLQLSSANLYGDPITGPEEDEYAAVYAEFQLGRDFGDYFLQADVFGELTDANNSPGSYAQGIGFAAHLLRQTSYGGFGVFGGGFRTDQDTGGSDNSHRLFGGLEAQLNRNEADYYFQLGYLTPGGGSDTAALNRAFFGRVVAQTELTKSLSLTGEIGGALGDVDDSDTTIWNFGIALNQKISDSLVASLSYDFIKYDQSNENDVIDEHIFGLGLTYSFGCGSSATTLSTPRLLRWTGVTGGQLE